MGTALSYALREDGGLGRFQRKIHVLNPKQVKKFKEAYPDLPKNDWVDAFVIADHLRFGRIAKEVYVNKYQHKRALALTARKLVRLVFRLLKDNLLYIPARGLSALLIFQNFSGARLGLMLSFCCLHCAFFSFLLKFFLITYLTSYHWTFILQH